MNVSQVIKRPKRIFYDIFYCLTANGNASSCLRENETVWVLKNVLVEKCCEGFELINGECTSLYVRQLLFNRTTQQDLILNQNSVFKDYRLRVTLRCSYNRYNNNKHHR